MLVRVERHPAGPRLFILGWRSEHWKAGFALIGWGVWWVWKDRADLVRAIAGG